MQFEKHNPGCYHSMVKYLSEKTGISYYKELVTQNVWTTKKDGKKKLAYSSYDITVVDKEGQQHKFMEDNKRFDQRGIAVNHFIVKMVRPVKDFGIEVAEVGNYRDSLGGGWYSNCALFEIDGKYFAYMECSCK